MPRFEDAVTTKAIKTGNSMTTAQTAQGVEKDLIGITPDNVIRVGDISLPMDLLFSHLIINNLPESDPGIPGRVYKLNGVVMISEGA